jgi:hypothetical protein
MKNLFFHWFWNIQLFANKYTQVGIYIYMAGNICTITINMIQVFVMFCAMFNKTTTVNIKMFNKFYSFHIL